MGHRPGDAVTRAEARALAELACKLDARCAPGPVYFAELLIRLARSYQRIQETACNRELTPREKAREKSLERRLTEEAKARGLGITFSGDPRGFVVKLQFPDGASNTWGQDGWGIG